LISYKQKNYEILSSGRRKAEQRRKQNREKKKMHKLIGDDYLADPSILGASEAATPPIT
jgi:hypothetical protein